MLDRSINFSNLIIFQTNICKITNAAVVMKFYKNILSYSDDNYGQTKPIK